MLNALSNRTQVHSPMVEDSTAEAPDVDDLLQKIRVLEQEKKHSAWKHMKHPVMPGISVTS